MKSLVRVKALLALLIVGLGIVQLFPPGLWAAVDPTKSGIALVTIGALITMNLRCEKCGVSLVSAFLELEKYEYEKMQRKRVELLQIGHRLFPYRKRCVHCGLERR